MESEYIFGISVIVLAVIIFAFALVESVLEGISKTIYAFVGSFLIAIIGLIIIMLSNPTWN